MSRIVAMKRLRGIAAVTPSAVTRGILHLTFGLTHALLPVTSVRTVAEAIAWCRAIDVGA